MKPDFSGYATKAGLKCSDGRTIMPEAFKHMDGQTVPLVWQHGHDKPDNVLGHAVLEAREDGVYAYGYFNNTKAGQNAKDLVEHEDIKSLSIYANKLIERGKQVFHGIIREVSLVLSGANPGAFIDHIAVQHSDGTEDILEDEAIIYTGLEFKHSDEQEEEEEEEEVEHAEKDTTVQEIYDSLTDEQKNVVHYMIGAALEAATDKSAEHSEEGGQTTEGNKEMKHNVFETNGGSKEGETETHELTHDDVKEIVEDAAKRGSLKAAVEAYALQHGIENIDILFPDAKTLDATPEWIKRRQEWVGGVINGVRSVPFSRIKTRTADITHDEARAKGYIKGEMKKEEFFGVAQRSTTPHTIYKKQGLDRDDILDITDFDVVAWLKGEMRMMLEEEVARAILIGDGREVEDEDKVRDPAGAPEGSGIRSILLDHELYAHDVEVAVPNEPGADYEVVVEEVARARRFYKGSGTPTFYTTEEVKTEMLLSKDNYGRRRYNTEAELASALRVDKVVAVEVMEPDTEDEEDYRADLLGIIVNLSDYAVGTDKGGEVNFFDDFDIDYNKYKYLIETRLSGGLTKVKSALRIRRVAPTPPE